MEDLTILVYDIECYPNYFMIGYSVATPIIEKNRLSKFEYKRYYVDSRDRYALKNFIFRLKEVEDKLVMVGFNNGHYDKVMLQECYNSMDRADMCSYLFDISQGIISNTISSWKYNMFNSQFDLKFDESMSLKSSAVILHHNTIQELPYEPTKELTKEEIDIVIKYNQDNDLWITEDLLNVFKGTFDSMYAVIKTFNLPLSAFSFTERNLVENVICDKGAKGNPTFTTTYKCPFNFKFKDNKLEEIKSMYENSVFKFGDKCDNTYMLGELECNFGLGGLHACVPQYIGKNLIDVDVASYYPNLMRVLDALPNTVKDKAMYYKMITDRVALKKTDPVKASAYKIILNATFGALGYMSKENKKVGKLFDFSKLMLITITGQLLIMKLAEDLTLAGYKVVYINTDGLMIENNGDTKYKEIMSNWQKETDLILEESEVVSAVLKDVNNYIITEKDGTEEKTKTKGIFCIEQAHVKKLTTNYAKRRISIQAVIDYILKGTPIEQTIKSSTNIQDFILHHKFGRQFVDINCNGTKLGRVVRWYKSNKNKNQLSSTNSETGTPLCPAYSRNITIVEDLSTINGIPSDLDYDFYLTEAYSIYNDLTGDYVHGNKRAVYMIEQLKIALCPSNEEVI